MWSFHEPFLVPPESAEALRQARLRAGLSLERVGESCGVPPARIAALEAGTVSGLDDPRQLLVALERFATVVGLPPGATVEDTLRAWSAAYRSNCRKGRRRALTDEPTESRRAGAEAATEPHAREEGADRPSDAAPSRRDPDATRARTRPSRSLSRALVGAVWLAAVALIASSATLGAAHAGVLRHLRKDAHTGAIASAPVNASPSAPLLAQVATGPAQATYRVADPTFELTLTSSRTSWVQVSAGGGSPVFSGVVEPGEVRSFSESAAVLVEVGADGAILSVSSNGRSETLSPPGAPFTYELATNGPAR